MSGCLLYRLAVVGLEEPRVGAAHMHVHRGLFLASAEEARLQEDGNSGEPLLPDAEPALHRVCPSLARSARWLVAAAVRSLVWT